MKKLKYALTAVLTLSPLVAFAATTDLKGLITLIIGYLNYALALLMGIAVVMFVYYVVQFFIRPIGGEQRAEALKYLMWSLIGFFVILSFWGIVNILITSFQFGQNSPGSWSNFSNIFPK